MEYINQAEEYHGLQRRYAEMSDEELEALSGQMESLTEIARQVLRAEFSRRGLGPQGLDSAEDPREVARRALRAEKSRRESAAQAHAMPDEFGRPAEMEGSTLWFKRPLRERYDPAAFDLVAIWDVSDPTEAHRVMEVLDHAGINAFLGPENVESVDDYKGSYEDGVQIKVMKFQSRIAVEGLSRLFPPKPEDCVSDNTEYGVYCPSCSSQDVIFQGFDVEPGESPIADPMYNWTCAACGYEWKDEGMAKSGGRP